MVTTERSDAAGPHPMLMKLDATLVAERLRGFTPSNYTFVYGLMKNVALAAAAYVFLTLFDDRETMWPRIALWLAAIGLVLITHTTAARGILLASFRYSTLDAIVPLAIGIAETLMFFILQPSEKHPLMWQNWGLVCAFHSGLAIVLVHNRLQQTKDDDFQDDLQPLVQDLLEWLWADRMGAFFSCVIFLAFWALSRWPTAHRGFAIDFVVAGVAILISGIVVVRADRQRAHIVNFIATRRDEATPS